MSQTIVLEKTQITELPKPFEEYINKKLEGNRKGRTHIVKQLGSMEKILELLSDVWIQELENKQLLKKYNVGYYSVYRFLKDVEEFKQQIIAYIHYIEEIQPKNFRSYQIVKEWEKKIRRSGHLSSLNHITVMENICSAKIVKTFKCRPDKFDLTKAQEFVDKYLEANPKETKVPRHLRMAIRHFLMVAKGINIPRGMGDQHGLSGQKDTIGQYSDIRLTEHQIKIIRKYLESNEECVKLGYDIIFRISFDSPHRAFALGSIPTRTIDLEHGTFKVFEPKVKKGDKFLGYEGLWFDGFIITDKTLPSRIKEFIDQHKDRELLFIEGKPTKMKVKSFLMGWYSRGKLYKKGLSQYLKEAYQKADITEPYFYKKPIHALRHAGAQRLLDLTDWNYDLVAELGGWLETSTLKRWYGKMPPSVKARKISELRKTAIGD